MSSLTRCVICFFVIAVTMAAPDTAAAQDLRDQFGTKSAAATQALHEGIQLVQAQKAREGLAAIRRAIGADPDLQLAYYWMALGHADLGEIDDAFKAYERIMEAAERTRVTSVTIDGCVNMALTL